MNSTISLTEEKQGTSSIGLSDVIKYKMPYIPLSRFEDADTSATIMFTSDVISYHIYFTTPRVDISRLYETGTTTPRTEVIYKKPISIEALLGDKGERVLGEVINLIDDTSREHDWPLNHVEVIYLEDIEVENWQYILVVLVFNCDFEIADKYLHNLYEELDSLANALGSEDQNILQRKIFFDVTTTL